MYKKAGGIQYNLNNMKHKQYILLAGPQKYPNHGVLAIQDSFDTDKQAFDHFILKSHKNNWEWFQIVNRDTWEIILAQDPSGTG